MSTTVKARLEQERARLAAILESKFALLQHKLKVESELALLELQKSKLTDSFGHWIHYRAANV